MADNQKPTFDDMVAYMAQVYPNRTDFPMSLIATTVALYRSGVRDVRLHDIGSTLIERWGYDFTEYGSFGAAHLHKNVKYRFVFSIHAKYLDPESGKLKQQDVVIQGPVKDSSAISLLEITEMVIELEQALEKVSGVRFHINLEQVG